MEPSVMNIQEKNNTMYFTLSNCNVSYANGLRRTILSNIPTVVIRTFPYEKNDVNFEINNTRLNNEILKQRISCIPIHMPITTILEDYVLEVDIVNNSEQTIFVTSNDFKIKNVNTNKYLNPEIMNEIFPPNSISKQYIDLCRLRPKYSDNFQAEHIKFTAKFSIGTASEFGGFNVVSICSYGFTPDLYTIEEEKQKKLLELKEKYDDDKDIEYQIKDWLLLDAKRIYIPDSFDFRIKSIGTMPNIDIVKAGILNLISELEKIKDIYSKNTNLISKSDITIENAYDITLESDYTIGKILEFNLYEKHYLGDKIITFCGFRKPHPHINNSIIRLAFKTETDITTVSTLIIESANNGIDFYKKLLSQFGELSDEEKKALKSIPN